MCQIPEFSANECNKISFPLVAFVRKPEDFLFAAFTAQAQTAELQCIDEPKPKAVAVGCWTSKLADSLCEKVKSVVSQRPCSRPRRPVVYLMLGAQSAP